jgi:hypothetical protein
MNFEHFLSDYFQTSGACSHSRALADLCLLEHIFTSLRYVRVSETTFLAQNRHSVPLAASEDHSSFLKPAPSRLVLMKIILSEFLFQAAAAS